MKTWLADKYRRSFIDTESIITELLKIGILKETSIQGKGLPTITLCLIKDILVIRTPPSSILEDPVNKGLPFELIKRYSKEVREYFEKYNPSEQDIIEILNILTIPIAYEILGILRTGVLTKTEFYNRFDYDKEDISQIIEVLENLKIIKSYKTDGETEYIVLFNDIWIESFFPEYVFNLILSDYNQKTKANQVIYEYLRVLEDEYF